MKILLMFAAFVSIAAAQDICRLPPKVGPCKASMPRFYYNFHSKKCELFIYGGCRGNGNRFERIQDCWTACGSTHRPKMTKEAIVPDSIVDEAYPAAVLKPYKGVDFDVGCRPTPERGLCLASIKRWFFNVNTGTCETFIYGGCGGNANNYETRRACEVACHRF